MLESKMETYPNRSEMMINSGLSNLSWGCKEFNLILSYQYLDDTTYSNSCQPVNCGVVITFWRQLGPAYNAYIPTIIIMSSIHGHYFTHYTSWDLAGQTITGPHFFMASICKTHTLQKFLPYSGYPRSNWSAHAVYVQCTCSVGCR